MSDTVGLRGTLIPIPLNGMSLQEKAKEIVHELDIDVNRVRNNDFLELLTDDYDYVSTLGKLYEVDSTKFDPSFYSDFNENDDGTISFMTIFHNGGTCFEELAEEFLSGETE